MSNNTSLSGGALPSPPIWRHARGLSIFAAPVIVEVWKDGAYVVSATALAALTDNSDRTAISGRLRVTFPGVGAVAVLGRARGDLSRLPLAYASWLGIDAAHDARFPPNPSGWHPVAFRAPSTVLELDTRGLRLSRLTAHAIGAL